jgi:hypothetical protein
MCSSFGQDENETKSRARCTTLCESLRFEDRGVIKSRLKVPRVAKSCVLGLRKALAGLWVGFWLSAKILSVAKTQVAFFPRTKIRVCIPADMSADDNCQSSRAIFVDRHANNYIFSGHQGKRTQLLAT